MKNKVFNKEMSEEQILDKISDDAANTAHFNTGSSYLTYKLHQQLLDEQKKWNKDILDKQNEYNEKQLTSTTNLVCATWILAIATGILVIITYFK